MLPEGGSGRERGAGETSALALRGFQLWCPIGWDLHPQSLPAKDPSRQFRGARRVLEAPTVCELSPPAVGQLPCVSCPTSIGVPEGLLLSLLVLGWHRSWSHLYGTCKGFSKEHMPKRNCFYCIKLHSEILFPPFLSFPGGNLLECNALQ